MPRPILRQTPAINTTQPVGFWRQTFQAFRLMVGTGVFVGMGIAIEVAGVGIIGAIALAALLALVNWGSIVQPMPPSTNSDISPIHSDWQHFTAGWTLFLCRLTAVATAALGLAGYLLKGLRLADPIWLVPMALAVVVVLTLIAFCYQPPRKSFVETTVIVAVVALLGLIFAGLPEAARLNPQDANLLPWRVDSSWNAFGSLVNVLQAGALISVAYASDQNRVAVPTVNPRQTLEALRLAIVFAWVLYLGVAIVSLSTLGSLVELDTAVFAAPLATVMQNLSLPGGVYLITLGAVAAMTGMAVDLLPKLACGVLELSRSPAVLATGQPPEMRLSPRPAKLLVSIALGCIVLAGEVKTIWAFSAFAFLLYAALMHWIALRRNATHYPRWQQQLGMAMCLFLAFWVNWDVWLVSLGLIALALIWRGVQYWSEDP